MSQHPPTTPDTWQCLSQFTAARIALGRAGISLPTRACLDFQLAHALARDAVNLPLDFDQLAHSLSVQGIASLCLHSQAANQQIYLQRPDLGRLLSPCQPAQLTKTETFCCRCGCDYLRRPVINRHNPSCRSFP